MSEKIFPTILIIMQILASIPYLRKGDWWMVTYWIAASVLNIAVTFRR